MIYLSATLIIGLLLRLTYVNDMEYKEDEEYNFIQTQLIGITQPWPWYGMPSGVYLANPGMSIWVFAILAKLFGITQPTSLAHAVQLFSVFGMSLILPFVWKFIQEKKEKITWLWAFLLAMVNPFLVLYQRKLWPEPFLPFFSMLTLMGWWKKNHWQGALTWGLIGALIGQVHMSGFFFALALVLWTLFFDSDQNKTHWKFWWMGSFLGTLPLIPWFKFLFQNPIDQPLSRGWEEMIQLKYWTFWLTDPTGLHLGNPLGLLRGNSNWDQISDFIRYPLIQGHPSFLVGLAHLTTLLSVLFILQSAVIQLWANRKQTASLLIGKSSKTAFVQSSAFWGCGILLTLTGINIRRYYLTVTFPLEFIFLIRMANPEKKLGKILLTLLFFSELFISANFVSYIHINGGSIQGDYGKAYYLSK